MRGYGKVSGYGEFLSTFVTPNDKSRFARIVKIIGQWAAYALTIGVILFTYNGKLHTIGSHMTAYGFFVFMACLSILGLRNISKTQKIPLGIVIWKLAILFIIIPGAITGLLIWFAFLIHAPVTKVFEP